MSRLKIISLLIILLVLTIFGSIYFSYFLSNITGKAVTEIEDSQPLNYSYTTAVCNPNKECIDLHITCSNKTLVKLEPVSGLLKMPDNWQDPRSESKDYCE